MLVRLDMTGVLGYTRFGRNLEDGMSDTNELKAKKHTAARGYPGIDLEKAIELARLLYERERRQPTPVEVVIEQHWGMSSTSSTARLSLAALKKFGLLESEGAEVHLTDRALDVLNPNPDDPKRSQEALRAAALDPPLHRELWEKHRGKTEQSISWYLDRQRNFSPAAIKEALRNYQRSLAFAGLSGDDINRSPEADPDSQESQRTAIGLPDSPVGIGGHQYHASGLGAIAYGSTYGAPPPDQGGAPPIVLTLPTTQGKAVEIRFPFRVSKREFDRLRTMFELSEPAFVDEDA